MPKVKQQQQQHQHQQKTKRKRSHDDESVAVAGAAAAAAEVEDEGDSNVDVDEGDGDGGDGDGGDGDGDRDGDGDGAITAERHAELAAQCSKYVQTHRSIKDLATQVGVLRKTLKEQEKNLLAVMQNVKLEEVVVDGSKITRSRKLQIFDE